MVANALRVVCVSQGVRWHAFDGQRILGAARAVVRPDGRCFVSFDTCRADAYEPLLLAVAGEVDRPLHVVVDQADGEGLRRYQRLGFAVERREGRYVIPVGRGGSGLDRVEVPAGFVLESAGEADEERLRELDDALRQDVPGTDGWRWEAADFREETFGSPFFDAALYWVAVVESSGGYAGLARVWSNPDGPRLGLVGVLAPHRRSGLAKALLARVFGVLVQRGATEVTAEIDEDNAASLALLGGLGARRVGGFVELVRSGVH